MTLIPVEALKRKKEHFERGEEDRRALEDGGVVSSGGAVLLVVATGAACGCGMAPDSPPVVRQPVITTMTPALQASSKRIRITHLVEFSIGDRTPRAEGSFGRISPKSKDYVFA